MHWYLLVPAVLAAAVAVWLVLVSARIRRDDASPHDVAAERLRVAVLREKVKAHA